MLKTARRTHRKSRNGCSECKRRHVKCDESRPSCANCTVLGRHCSYITQHSPLSTTSSPAAATPESSSASHAVPSPQSNPGAPLENLSIQDPSDQFKVNLLHMKLMVHFLADACNMFGTAVSRPALDATLKVALSAPYLVHEVLAISALHLSTLCPTEQQFYWNQAAGLQTQALSIFNNSQQIVDTTNCASMLLFSSLISMHVLFNAATSAGSHSEFLDKFITYLHVHRGVRIITSGSWHLIRQSELASIIPDVSDPDISGTESQTHQGSERECDMLKKLFDSTDLNQASIDTCRSAIEHLQWAFDMDRAKPDLKTGIHMVFAWPVLVSAEYTHLLSKRNPEALIILAYYAVLLYSRRRVWIVGDTSITLIQSISTLLGTYWEPWLTWPNSVIATTSSST